MIEDDIRELREIVQALHGKMGHVWTRGAFYRGAPSGYRTCACGATEYVHDRAEFDALKMEYEIGERF